MEVYALSSSWELVTANVPYLNLQWNRKYYEAGDWEMQLPAEAYDPSWHYVVSNDRDEVGLVQKLEYDNSSGSRMVTVSGFFAEKVLDGIVCSPRFVTDKAHTETAIQALVEKMQLKAKKNVFPFWSSTPLGNRTQCDFLGDNLGTKVFSILETRELSYRVRQYKPTARTSALMMEVWQGVDRTVGQTANVRALFSTSFGNVSGETVSIDDSAFANVCIVTAEDEALTFEVDQSGGGERFETFLDKSSEKPDDDQSEADFKAALEQSALERLSDCAEAVDITVDTLGDSGYRMAYDLGDLVTVELPDIGLSLDTRIVEVTEVFKSSGHTVTLGFGNKRISNIERAVLKG